ncbi:MAG TPA: TCR/Tet family MFS transporter [Cyclobacteriaceae bacterium]|nr:TCR/Tet family MFS transporter [Cyclobacteriaceae bacterium]HPW61090.1 TCR/Tet family MFS transporter [Cyclobacteriaceae bacterium]
MKSSKQAAIGFIFVTLLIDTIGFGIIIPVLPNLIIELTHGTTSEAARIGGWLLFAFAIVQFLFAPILGGLSDQYGRRPILLGSLFGFGLDYIFLALAPTIGWLFVGRLIAGALGASFTTAGAYIADISTPEKRGQNFGMIGAAFGLGFIIGPGLGGLLGSFGPRVPFMAAAGLSLLNWLYGYFILPESLKVENRRKFEWKRANPVASLLNLKRYPVVLGLVASLVLIYIASHAVQSNWSYYTIEKFGWSSAMIGASLAAVGILIAIVQGGLIRIIIPAWGQKNSLYIGLALYSIGFVLFAFATEGWMMFAFLIPYCLGGIAGPALQGIISSQVPANEQGELQGALTSLMSVTSIIGPLLMTQLFSAFTGPAAALYFPGAPMAMGGVLTLLSLILAMRALAGFTGGKH